MRPLYLLLLLACQNQIDLPAQPPTAAELLELSVAHHDPGGNWATFNTAFTLNRDTIVIDLPGQYFAQLTGGKYYVVDGAVCRYDDVTGAPGIASDSCATARRKRDYHTYLNGLPMKLQDPGTPLADEVVTREFHGKEYDMLTVNYPKDGGTFETWEFYLDQETHALGGYQFYRSDDPAGGEYLLLEGEIEIGGVRMVESKEWFLRKDGKRLGKDVILGEVAGVARN